MKISAFIQRRLHWINLPGALLVVLLQRMPAVTAVAIGDEMVVASPMSAVLKAAVAGIAALGAVNTMVGATPLVPSSGTASGITVNAGSPVSVFYTVNGTQTPPMSWTVSGAVPPGLNFSGLNGSGGAVNVGTLQLSGTPTAGGSYSVDIETFEFIDEGGVGSPIYHYTITVNGSVSTVAPSFTTQPSSQSVTTGNSVTFTAAASGTPAPTYQWQKNNANIGGATSSSFSIANVAAGDAGSYAVVASNSAGSVTSNAATLTVSVATSAPSFTTQPVSQSVTTGGAVTFTTAASGTPTPTYQWQMNNVNISGATNATYSIASAAAGDAGSYTVTASNSAGSVTSNAATLTVSVATSAPSFTTQPASQSVTTGGAVTFTAAASGTPTPTYQWQKNNANISGATNATYSIASAAAGDAGSYTVVASNSAGSVTSNAATLTVSNAAVAPAIDTPPAGQTVIVGSSVTFAVAANGSPTPTLQWKKGGAVIAGATGTTFSISNVTSTDAASYTVTATNSAGTVTSSAAALSVQAGRLISETVTSGHGVSLSAANASGSIQWQVSSNGGTTWTNLANNGTYSGVTSSTLSITNADSSLSSLKYRFVATDNGSISNSPAVSLTVEAVILPFPTSIVADSAGNLYVGDANANTVQKITSAGVTTLVAGANGTSGSSDGAGSAARFNQPNGITLLASGTIIVADTGNATIRSVTASGMVTTLAGSPDNRGNTDAAGNAATFSSPTGICRDTTGVLYIADAMNDTIRKVTADGAVTTVAGSANAIGFADGTGAAARFNFPSGVAVDSSGNLYVADTTNNLIRKITPGGAVSTLAGVQNVAGFDDGTGSGALFNHPGGMAVDAAGNIYLADTGNSTVRKITPAGTVTTIAGTPTVAGLEDGAGIFALLNHPQSLSVDGSGNIFVADTGNAAIRKIDAQGNVSTLALTSGATSSPGTTTPPPTTTPPAPTPTPMSSGGGGGGGGGPSLWFLAALALLGSSRRRSRARSG